METGSPPKIWLGGSDSGAEGTWSWLDGQGFWLGLAVGLPLNGLYVDWAFLEPSGLLFNSDCLAMDLGNSTPGWSDATCSDSSVFVCESP